MPRMAGERVQREIERLLDEAVEAAAKREWDVVRERAEHALTFDPENVDAQDRDRAGVPGRRRPRLLAPRSPPPEDLAPPPAGGRSWAEIARFVGQRKLSITADTYTHVLTSGEEIDYAEVLR